MVPVHVDYAKMEATKQYFPTFTFALTHSKQIKNKKEMENLELEI